VEIDRFFHPRVKISVIDAPSGTLRISECDNFKLVMTTTTTTIIILSKE